MTPDVDTDRVASDRESNLRLSLWIMLLFVAVGCLVGAIAALDDDLIPRWLGFVGLAGAVCAAIAARKVSRLRRHVPTVED
jgi:1,4-dihydroxy-2-naphthoate octaprenyltransferase